MTSQPTDPESIATDERRTALRMPIHRIVFGKLEALIWCSPQEDGSREYTTTIERLVQQENAAWTRRADFGPVELRLLPALSEQAYDYIRAARRIDRENDRARQGAIANTRTRSR